MIKRYAGIQIAIFIISYIFCCTTFISVTISLKLRTSNLQFSRISRLPCKIEGTMSVDDFHPWYNEKYSQEQLQQWFNEIEKPLITVGIKGITPELTNSVIASIKHHGRIRIKLSSDRLDCISLANAVLSDVAVSSIAELLLVRKRSFMIGATEEKIIKDVNDRKLKLLALQKDVTKIKCYNCGEMGHFSSNCPIPIALKSSDGLKSVITKGKKENYVSKTKKTIYKEKP